jgi:predicted amidophosphoribosyltransferase
MDTKPDEKERFKKAILKHFHLDKFCPQCNQPMEVDNNISCKLCAFKKKIKTQIDIADNAIHSLRTTIKE